MKEIITNRKIEPCEESGKTVIRITDTIEVDNYNFENRVKTIAYIKDLDLADVARKFGISQKANFIARLNTGRLQFAEQRKIAEILGVDIVIKLVIGQNEITAESASEMIRECCTYRDRTLLSLAKELGVSRQALNTKLNCDRFDHKEIEKIAKLLGGKYCNYFVIDGIRI